MDEPRKQHGDPLQEEATAAELVERAARTAEADVPAADEQSALAKGLKNVAMYVNGAAMASLVSKVSGLARRRPTTFFGGLGGAILGGVLLGRLLRRRDRPWTEPTEY